MEQLESVDAELEEYQRTHCRACNCTLTKLALTVGREICFNCYETLQD